MAALLVDRAAAAYPDDMSSPVNTGSTDSTGNAEAPEATEVLIGDFCFVAATGELRRHDDSNGDPSKGPDEPQRLPPQPARLLSLLIEKRGAVASHEDIRQRLWPEVAVDFEQGLHFCVRQVRAALGDQASHPRYIETLPRRGYRLLVDVVVPDANDPPALAESPQDHAEPAAGLPTSWWPGALAVLGLAAILCGLLIAGRSAFESPPKISTVDSQALAQPAGPTNPTATPAAIPASIPRLAIMSFHAPEDRPDLATQRIADLLLLRLGPLAPDQLALIGPTTTARYATDLHSVHQFTLEHPVDYLINGRFIDSEAGPGTSLIAELIRADDGAHVYVAVFDDLATLDPVAQQIGDGIIRFLELDE